MRMNPLEEIPEPHMIRCVGRSEVSGTWLFERVEIIDKTPCGVRIKDLDDRIRFIKLRTGIGRPVAKQWASETEEKAIDCYKRRLLRRRVILRQQLTACEELLRIAEVEE